MDDDAVARFLDEHPTTARWLDDIVDVLVTSYRGSAHVRDIAHALSRLRHRDINSLEETITRRINDFCSDAADFKKSARYDLFQRVAPATYRLRSFPHKPDVYELTSIGFEQPAMELMWGFFARKYREQLGPNGPRSRTGGN